MTRKIYFLLNFVFCLFLLASTTLSAQDAGTNNRTASLKFNSQPDHMWEVGIHGGHQMVIGDIWPRPGFGFGAHVRRALDYAWAMRLDFVYGNSFGLEPRNSGGTATGPASANRVLKDLGYGNGNAGGNDWYHSYKMKYMSLSLHGVWSLNSFNFKNQTRKLNWFILGGPGIATFETFYDAKDAEGNIYDFSNIDNGLNTNSNREDRKTALSSLKDMLDGEYETRAETALGRRSGVDDSEVERQYNAQATVGAGVAWRINKKFNIALEHQVSLIFGNEGDLLDGYRHRSTVDLTQFKDLINYTNVRLNFNLGNHDEKSEPLWWVSPMDLLAQDVADIQARPKLDMTDTDGDGVIDMLDQEKNTQAGCAVDTRGIILDSDNDGVVDCKDKEPYTPAGYVGTVDADGVANIPTPNYITEGDVNRIVDSKIAGIKVPRAAPAMAASDWFLPMIHFDFNKYAIRDVEYGKLHNVATVLKQNPGMRVLVEGHTDKTSGNCYNDVLSYNRAKTAIDYLVQKYGISRDRLILRYGGENTNLVPTNAKNLMNRRVEFNISKGGESDMGKPDCRANAGVGGTNFSGNKEAGF